MTWTLIVAVAAAAWSGGYTLSTVRIPMQDRAACVRAAEAMAEQSGGATVFSCVSSQTGEVVIFRGRNK